jgi:hypothetical protein
VTSPDRHRIASALALFGALGCGGPSGRHDDGDTDPIVVPPVPDAPDTGPDPVTGPTDPLPNPPSLARYAVIGDYGSATDDEAAVAALVDALAPDAVLTVGDNSYDTTDGKDSRIGQYYQQYIWPYSGAYGTGAADGVNRFWPAMGNHDWDGGLDDWYLFFELPGNERYFSVPLGTDPETGEALVELFVVDGDTREPDGNDPTSLQAMWLRDALDASRARWQFVSFHQPSYSSGTHGDNLKMQWPFQEWGADLVLVGHDHLYEKTVRDGLVQVTDGRGGMSLYRTIGRSVWSELVFDADYGLTAIDVGLDDLAITALTPTGGIADEFRILHDHPFSPDEHIVRFGSTWRWSGADAYDPAWKDPGFDDGAWASGPSALGFGEGDEATRLPTVPAQQSWFFRQRFQVAAVPTDPLELTLIRDDGAAVYLNGVEVLRDNLPAGELTADTVAVTDLVLATDEEAPVLATIDPALLSVGDNVLAVELHQSTLGTLDLSFDLALRAKNESRLLAEGAEWRYRESPPPVIGWQQAAFDDSRWAVGHAPFGYGHDGVATALFEGDPLARPAAAWFRTTFDVANPAAVSALWLSFVRDDGVVIWLNGREVHRTNMAAGPPDPAAYALSESGVEWADQWSGTFLDPGDLVAGENTVAVEVHQGAAAGVDLRFDLRLIGL